MASRYVSALTLAFVAIIVNPKALAQDPSIDAISMGVGPQVVAGIAVMIGIAAVIAIVMKLQSVLMWLLKDGITQAVADGMDQFSERVAAAESGIEEIKRRFGDGEHSLIAKLESLARGDIPRDIKALNEAIVKMKSQVEQLHGSHEAQIIDVSSKLEETQRATARLVELSGEMLAEVRAYRTSER